MRTIILVGLGGGIGSILRYLTSLFVAKYFHADFPWGTLFVNVMGSLLIGLLLGFILREQFSHPDLKFFLVVGFCGGYTTFSAFSAESINLLQTGNFSSAFLYIAASVAISLFAVWAGLAVMKFC